MAVTFDDIAHHAVQMRNSPLPQVDLETEQRAIVSRAYYASYHAVKDLSDICLTSSNADSIKKSTPSEEKRRGKRVKTDKLGGVHKQLIDSMAACGYGELAQKLKEAKALRVRADYRLTDSWQDSNVEKILDLAKNVIEACQHEIGKISRERIKVVR